MGESACRRGGRQYPTHGLGSMPCPAGLQPCGHPCLLPCPPPPPIPHSPMCVLFRKALQARMKARVEENRAIVQAPFAADDFSDRDGDRDRDRDRDRSRDRDSDRSDRGDRGDRGDRASRGRDAEAEAEKAKLEALAEARLQIYRERKELEVFAACTRYGPVLPGPHPLALIPHFGTTL